MHEPRQFLPTQVIRGKKGKDGGFIFNENGDIPCVIDSQQKTELLGKHPPSYQLGAIK